MKLYPAIDIINRKAVRLTKGDFSKMTTYNDNPVTVAQDFAAAGAPFLHVIDLDGAKAGQPVNTETIKEIKAATHMQMQVGGGLRSIEAVRDLIDAGIDRVIVGSVAVTQPDLAATFFQTFTAERITLAIDCMIKDGEPMVAIHGWQTESDVSIWTLIDRYCDFGLRRVLCTDIDRDGAQQGTNIELYRRIRKRYPQLNVQASGGVASLTELTELAQAGIESCVIGKALYEGEFTLTEALATEGVTC